VLKRTRRMSVVTLLLLAMSALVGVAQAAACNPGRTPNANYDWFVGSNTGPTFDGGNCISGIASPIEVRNPYVESADVTAYVLQVDPLADNNLGDGAQIGWRNTTPNYTRSNFAEYVEGTWFSRKEWTAASVGSFPTYQMTYSGGAFHANYNSTDYYTFGDADYSGCWGVARGETHNVNSQMPGVQVAHGEFFGITTEFTSGGGWQFLPQADWVHGAGAYTPPSPITSCLAVVPGVPNCLTVLDTSNGVHFGYNYSSQGGITYINDIWDMCQ
jgi:hypothetical protein